jgi:hypothetical protein
MITPEQATPGTYVEYRPPGGGVWERGHVRRLNDTGTMVFVDYVGSLTAKATSLTDLHVVNWSEDDR